MHLDYEQQSLGLSVELEQAQEQWPDLLPMDELTGFRLTRHITDGVCAHYAKRAEKGLCQVYRELPNTTGFDISRFIDVYVQFLYRMNSYRRIAYEVKISRGDFLSELRNPEKRVFALRVSEQYYFAAPTGLILPREVPEEAGLVEITDGRLRVKKEAPLRRIDPAPWDFVAALVKAAGKSPTYVEAARAKDSPGA
jgi:hypothetical protein